MSTESTRRAFLQSMAARGVAGLGLGTACLPAVARAPERRGPRPRVCRAVHISVCGGFSQIDTFDPKPELDRRHGQSMPAAERLDPFFAKIGRLRRSDWRFAQHGESGLWVSDLLPHLASVADRLTVVRSMVAEIANHVPAKLQENTGFQSVGFPSLGAWLSYGLGPITGDLPAFVVIPDARGLPAGGAVNWGSGFLPAEHGGVRFRSQGDPVDFLFPGDAVDAAAEQGTRSMLAALQEGYRARYPDVQAAEERMRAYALAARLQRTVPEVADLGRESETTRRLYGAEDPDCAEFARSCLLTRRLLERGVRYVQLFVGGSFGSPRINWDGHEDMVENHQREARRMDRPLAGLIADLHRRGMLEDTLVLCTTEFGRSPYTQADADVVGRGRDHNEQGFTVWMAGGGLRAGLAYGATDELGHCAVEGRMTWPDLHATVLHLFGLDHQRLTFYHDGISRRLTNVHGRVVQGVLS